MGQVKPGQEQAVAHTQRGAHQEGREQPDRLVEARLRDDHRQDAHGKREHGADGQVDAPGQDDDEHSQREQRVHRCLAGNARQVARGQERRRREREDGDQQDQAEQGTQLEGDLGPVAPLFRLGGDGHGLRLR